MVIHLALEWDMDTSQVILVMKQNQKEGRPITEPRPYKEPELTEEMVNDPNYLCSGAPTTTAASGGYGSQNPQPSVCYGEILPLTSHISNHYQTEERLHN